MNTSTHVPKTLTTDASLGPAVLQIFLKAPRRGTVKTRLAKEAGVNVATAIYTELVASQLSRLPQALQTEVHFHPVGAAAEMQQWLGSKYSFHPQVAGDLGLKLEYAVQSAFTARAATSVICIGGDCPGLDNTHIEATLNALATGHDVVFGPTEDGGYYLIGLKQAQPELFREIPWSDVNTLKASLSKATKMGLNVQLLETLYDIDELKDLQRARDEGLLPDSAQLG
ncbi:MAG: rSAM/selenodomain-associated transferase 1 [Lentimonas sp.]|jgi:rSAM/selenodomain-associated transferase 1